MIVLLLLSASILVEKVSAQSRLIFPIPDLGYCRDAKECYLHCEIPENKATCWSYGTYKLGSDVLGVTTMSAQEKQLMESKAKQYNISFPIADLGNCAGPQECRDFCEQSSNQQACMDFAKKKGFQKETESTRGMDIGKRDELIVKAKTELGCTSMESCSKICETDQSRCEAFAKKHGVYQEPPESRGRYSAEEKMQLMRKAQSELGCTSMESCKSACEKNPERCVSFAKKHGFQRPEPREDTEEIEDREEMETDDRRPGPMSGKCDSEDSCKTYCQEHPKECPGFQPNTPESIQSSSDGITRMSSKENYVGPSGCRTEAECKNWCSDHPDKCPGFREAKLNEEQSKRQYELRKKETESSRELQKRQSETNREMMQKRMEQPTTNTQPYYDYRPSPGAGSSNYPTTSTQPTNQTIQPSSGSYTPPATQPTAPQ